MIQFGYRYCFFYFAFFSIRSRIETAGMHHCLVTGLSILCAGRFFPNTARALHGNRLCAAIYFIFIIKCDGRVVSAPRTACVLPIPSRSCVIRLDTGSRCRCSVRLLCRKAERGQVCGQNCQRHARCEKLLDFSSHRSFLPKTGPFRWKRPVYLPPGPMPRSILTK